MATGSKILRRNFALKIGSSKEMRAGLKQKQQHELATSFARSTSEMVKSYINGTYKSDSANNFWNELAHVNVAAPRAEHKGPLRTMIAASQPILPVISASGLKSLTSVGKRASTLKSNIPTKIPNGDDINKTRHAGAVAALTANRRLLKNSNGCYKIISNRRFGSSASSSCGSIFKRHDDRRRVSSFKRTVNGGFIERLYNTQPTNEAKSSLANISSSKYLLSLRNQKIPAPLGSVAEALRVSTNIQQELMPIDKDLRERISIKNTLGVGKANNSDQQACVDPMSGWHHPPSPDKLQTQMRLSDRLWYQREPPISNPPLITPNQTTSKAERSSHAASRSAERYSDRLSALKLNENELAQENSQQRMRVVRKPARLTLSCTPPAVPSSTAQAPTDMASIPIAGNSYAGKRIAASTPSASPLTFGPTNNLSSEDETQPRKMASMTARRIDAVEHTPVRRFSLRRPPKADLPQINPPAPGPAAESLNMQQHRSTQHLSVRTSPMSAFAENIVSNSGRYRYFNSRQY